MIKAFRFGVVSAGNPSGTAWLAITQRIEQLGYNTLLMPDRTMTPFAVVTALAVAATATKTLRVGSYVFANDYRHPAILAREIATLDQLSNGRVELGLGAGVGPTDFQQLGMPFDSAGTRVARFEEAVSIIKQFFTSSTVQFTGKYYNLVDLISLPRPFQQPHPPIMIAGSGRRILTIAAREANIIALALRRNEQGIDPTEVPLSQKLDWIREAAGERFASLEFAQSAFGITLTDSPVASSPVLRGGPPVQLQPMTIEQAVDHFLQQREDLGISYIQIQEGQIENFAPVLHRLSGK
jgi:probable F420-dependent oxidoreductase